MTHPDRIRPEVVLAIATLRPGADPLDSSEWRTDGNRLVTADEAAAIWTARPAEWDAAQGLIRLETELLRSRFQEIVSEVGRLARCSPEVAREIIDRRQRRPGR